LSVFQVVRFPNTGCTGSSSLNGTCYTTSECTNKGGTSSGSCANGFGVCCTFTLGCGGKIAENCTYFQSASSSQPAGQCGVTICKCSTDICQLRMDFNTFVIAGPSTTTASVLQEAGGSISGAGGKPASSATQCLTDSFTITGVPGGNPPVICGTNTGYHVYADASDSCNTIDFQLGTNNIGTTIPTRQWNIKITQISCMDVNRSPSGCTQYRYGSTSGVINSFNWANGVQLASQQQTICIRRERGYCKICYSTQTPLTDFQISGKTASKGFAFQSMCCGYGAAGLGTMGYDCLVIPGAAKMTTPFALLPYNAFCGQGGLITAAAAANVEATGGKTICTSQTPFKIDFLTDAYTQVDAINVKFRGFNLAYWETTC